MRLLHQDKLTQVQVVQLRHPKTHLANTTSKIPFPDCVQTPVVLIDTDPGKAFVTARLLDVDANSHFGSKPFSLVFVSEAYLQKSHDLFQRCFVPSLSNNKPCSLDQEISQLRQLIFAIPVIISNAIIEPRQKYV